MKAGPDFRNCEVQQRWNEDLHAIEESIKLMLTNHLQEAEDTKLESLGLIFAESRSHSSKERWHLALQDCNIGKQSITNFLVYPGWEGDVVGIWFGQLQQDLLASSTENVAQRDFRFDAGDHDMRGGWTTHVPSFMFVSSCST